MVNSNFPEENEPIEDEDSFDPDSYVPEGSNTPEDGLRSVNREFWIGGAVIAGIAIPQFVSRHLL